MEVFKTKAIRQKKSFYVRIPVEIVNKERIRNDSSVQVSVERVHRKGSLKHVFGLLKVKETTDEIMRIIDE